MKTEGSDKTEGQNQIAGLLVWTWRERQGTPVQARLVPLLPEAEVPPNVEAGACILVSEEVTFRASVTKKYSHGVPHLLPWVYCPVAVLVFHFPVV